jgi:uncharacterized metal-binding protein
MSCKNVKNTVQFKETNAICPIGEITGKKNIKESKIPVLSCEGACIRGEIARLAANIVSKEQAYGRGCHGELITVSDSAIARWIKSAERVVLIDGCFLRCHGRIFENLIDKEKLVQFDALSHYNKYTDIFEYDDVPEDERKEVAQSVAKWVMDGLSKPSVGSASSCVSSDNKSSGCCG